MSKNKEDKTVRIFCDGSVSPNPGTGGWGTLLLWRDKRKVLSGSESNSTNNRMELLAAIKGLEAVKKPKKVLITSDSQYVVRGISEWIEGWNRRGWKSSTGKEVKNSDLWKRMYVQIQRHKKVYAHWVEGHNGHPENEFVDDLAGKARLAHRQ